jgi:hypothetical protein
VFLWVCGSRGNDDIGLEVEGLVDRGWCRGFVLSNLFFRERKFKLVDARLGCCGTA